MEEARGDAGLSGPEPIFCIGYWKKRTGRTSPTWSDAVGQALCFGWIDGRLNRIDDAAAK